MASYGYCQGVVCASLAGSGAASATNRRVAHRSRSQPRNLCEDVINTIKQPVTLLLISQGLELEHEIRRRF